MPSRLIAMADTHDLPFELSAASVSDWLETLERLSFAEKLKMMTNIITELGNSSIEADRLFPVIDRLTETVLMLSNLLENFARSEKNSNTSDSVKKFRHYAVKLTKKLCFIYDNLSRDKTLAARDQPLCIFRAMQLLCLHIKRNTLFYEAPDLSLWKRLSELYLRAKTRNALTIAIDDQAPGLDRQPTIEALVKHALLFYICNANDRNLSEISAIFSAVGGLALLLKLDDKPSDSSYYWNPYLRKASMLMDDIDNPEQSVYLDLSELIDFFDTSGNKEEAYPALAPVMDRLTAYFEIRRSVNPAAQARAGLIIGIGKALKFLSILTSRYQILKLTGVLKDEYQKTGLELVPKDNEDDALAFLSTEIIKDEADLSVVKIKTYRTFNRNFRTAKIGGLEYSVDVPVILIYENQRPLFGIIRHIRTDTGTKLNNILLEIIDGAVYPIEID